MQNSFRWVARAMGIFGLLFIPIGLFLFQQIVTYQNLSIPIPPIWYVFPSIGSLLVFGGYNILNNVSRSRIVRALGIVFLSIISAWSLWSMGIYTSQAYQITQIETQTIDLESNEIRVKHFYDETISWNTGGASYDFVVQYQNLVPLWENPEIEIYEMQIVYRENGYPQSKNFYQDTPKTLEDLEIIMKNYPNAKLRSVDFVTARSSSTWQKLDFYNSRTIPEDTPDIVRIWDEQAQNEFGFNIDQMSMVMQLLVSEDPLTDIDEYRWKLEQITGLSLTV